MLRAVSRLQQSAAASVLRVSAPRALSGAHGGRCRCGACHAAGCACAHCSSQARGFSVSSQSHYDVPKTQKAVVISQTGAPLEVRNDWPVVQPEQLKPGEVLVRLAYTGVCHTDLHIWAGDIPMPLPLPLVGGHEGTGYVAAIGKDTKTRLQVGDAVGVKWTAHSCLGCEDCRKGHESTCMDQQVHGLTTNGTFQQWCVSFADHVTPIPKEVPLPAAAPILCAGVTVFKALKEFGGVCGETVVIPGAGGGLGHLACQYAIAMGYNVIAIDSGDDKRKLVESYGVKHFIDFKDGNLVEKVRELTGGRGAHASVVVAAGGDPYFGVQDYLRPHGTIVIVGVPEDPILPTDVNKAVQGSQRIIGTYVGNRQDAVEALAIAARGDVSTAYSVEALENLPSVFQRMKEGKISGRIVLDCE